MSQSTYGKIIGWRRQAPLAGTKAKKTLKLSTPLVAIIHLIHTNPAPSVIASSDRSVVTNRAKCCLWVA